ncbi:type I DNA topoisomerase [Thiotrichales bacterium 19S3-7]|nr:type I DNA topoisomerase [Thiotrichales bacterium 19S3-7]MCF6801410.1 type I DNA topoisomerase [Thiotrichales bacterium 19S3-11]
MSKNLVIVESPAKSKTIEKYLGKDFEVLASYGHVRDLPSKESSIEPDNDFLMHYQVIERNARHLEAIKKAAKKSETIYLATDPDREGEAISWHVCEVLKDAGLLENKIVQRIVFHEITKKAVQDAIANPRTLSNEMINAQQARRALDFLVGFNLSPLLWKKVQRGLSAGRVQSPALRLIVEREIEIEAFITQEYWSIHANVSAKDQPFDAHLTIFNNNKLEKFDISDETQAKTVVEAIDQTAEGKLTVSNVERKQRKRQPSPPFTTSTLQQEASRKLGFSTKRTMMVAQQLYEGIDLKGEGPVGLITYMRTDSVNLSNDAIDEIRQYIQDKFDSKMLPDSPRLFKTKSKSAQEAHEAIRPSSVLRHPDELKSILSADQLKLYTLIWKRTVACQMMHAVINTLSIDLNAREKHIFRASGSTIKEPGFMAVYQETKEAKKDSEEMDKQNLPDLAIGDLVDLLEIIPKQHFTEPPPRYSEAGLVKALEEYGIGRPSTYVAIISTLQQRGYAEIKQKRFHPTDIGRIVNKFLVEYFPRYIDYGFTAKLEDALDEISCGEKEWIPLMHDFWKPFKEQVQTIDQSVKKSDVTQEAIDENCPQCDSQLMIRLGKRGRFIGCSNYPECDYTRNLQTDNQEDDESNEPEIVADRKCPECQHDLLIKQGRYGKFIGCSNYPNCKHMEPLEKPKDTGVHCPKCKTGEIVEKKSRRGKVFYACNGYPKCKYSLWYPPHDEACPKCNWPIVIIKTTKKRGVEKLCPQEDCDFCEVLESAKENEKE